MKRWTSYGMPLIVSAFYFFLYIPIFVLVAFSFNDNALSYKWIGFTTGWYEQLFASTEIWQALQNSLFIAASSVVLSLILGSVFVFYASRTSLERLLVLFYGSLAI